MSATRRRSVRTLREDALAIWGAGVHAADAGLLVRRSVRVRGNALAIGADVRIPLDRVRRVVVVGAGKAGGAMAEALEEALGDRLLKGPLDPTVGSRVVQQLASALAAVFLPRFFSYS